MIILNNLIIREINNHSVESYWEMIIVNNPTSRINNHSDKNYWGVIIVNNSIIR